MDPNITVTPIASGTYRVEHDGRNDIVYVAGGQNDKWAFWNGHVFRADIAGETEAPRQSGRLHVAQSLAAPMPAKVLNVLAGPGQAVKRGDTVVLLEAMKMELPIRAPADAVIVAVHCRNGEMVEAGAPLIELE